MTYYRVKIMSQDWCYTVALVYSEYTPMGNKIIVWDEDGDDVSSKTQDFRNFKDAEEAFFNHEVWKQFKLDKEAGKKSRYDSDPRLSWYKYVD